MKSKIRKSLVSFCSIFSVISCEKPSKNAVDPSGQYSDTTVVKLGGSNPSTIKLNLVTPVETTDQVPSEGVLGGVVMTPGSQNATCYAETQFKKIVKDGVNLIQTAMPITFSGCESLNNPNFFLSFGLFKMDSDRTSIDNRSVMIDPSTSDQGQVNMNYISTSVGSNIAQNCQAGTNISDVFASFKRENFPLTSNGITYKTYSDVTLLNDVNGKNLLFQNGSDTAFGSAIKNICK